MSMMEEKCNVLLIENQLYNNQSKYKKIHLFIAFLLVAATTYLCNEFFQTHLR